MLTEAAVLDALRVVKDPDLHQDIVALGFIKDLRIDGGRVAFTIELTTPACPVKDQMREQARAAVCSVAGVIAVDVEMTAQRARGGRRRRRDARRCRREEHHRRRRRQGRRRQDDGRREPGRSRWRKCGSRVGIIDGDIYGPNVPIMLGMQDAARHRRQEDRAGREVRPAGRSRWAS